MGFAISKTKGLIKAPKRGLGAVTINKVQEQPQLQPQPQVRQSQFETVGFGNNEQGQKPRKKLAI